MVAVFIESTIPAHSMITSRSAIVPPSSFENVSP